MVFQDYLAETLFDLVHVVYANPTMEELCQFLAMRICLSGELARVYVGRLDSDGIIRTEGSFGYSTNIGIDQLETSLETSRPMPHAFKKREVYVANREEVLRDFQDYSPFDERSPWLATAVVPTLGKHVFVFRLQCHIEDKEPISIYFKAVGAILSFFDFGNSQSKTKLITKAATHNSLLGQALTSRQSEILEYIVERMTNVQIANTLGYSESLIKQETMIIYAKLGVNGRHDILYSSTLEERSSSIK